MKYQDKQLVILMAGKGTRLYPLTLGFPKCLLSVKQKPAIYNMLLPLIKEGLEDIIFVVNQENITLLKDFFHNSFSNLNLNIQYVVQSDFSGPGAALALTSDYLNLDKSVILLLGDTLCKYPDNYDYSFIGVTPVEENEKKNYCIITDENNKIIEIIDKPDYEVESNNAAIGLYYFKNAKLLSNVLKEKIDKKSGEYQLSSYFEKYKEQEDLYIQKIENWEDIGTLDGYMKTNKNNFNCRFFNTLFLDKVGVLHKKSIYDKVSSEMNWFRETKDTDFEKMSPKFYESGKLQNEYAIEYYDYLTLSEYFTFYPLSEYSKKYIFSSLMDNLLNLYRSNQKNDSSFKEHLKEILVDKTYHRIEEWERKDLINSNEIIINNQKYLGILPVLENLKDSILSLCNSSNQYISIIHGDPAFSNILFSPRNMLFKFIDPRGNFGIDTVYGDYRYDLAKLRHCYHGRYDEITNDLFKVKEFKQDNLVHMELTFYRDIDFTIFDEILKDKEIDMDDIELIEGLLFISMIPLHNDYPMRQIAFFSQGIKMLNNQLKRRGIND